MSYLREAGAVPERAPLVTPLGALLASYRSWMVQERGLALSTVLRYENTARRFLQESSVGGMFAPEALTGKDINAFCSGNSPGYRPGRRRAGWPSCVRSCVSSICRASLG